MRREGESQEASPPASTTLRQPRPWVVALALATASACSSDDATDGAPMATGAGGAGGSPPAGGSASGGTPAAAGGSVTSGGADPGGTPSGGAGVAGASSAGASGGLTGAGAAAGASGSAGAAACERGYQRDGDGCVAERDSYFATDGYATSGPLRGFLTTSVEGTDATLTPECNEFGTAPCFDTADASVCIAGRLALDYSSYAALTWNVQQDAAPPMTAETWIATGSGLAILLHDFSEEAAFGSPLQIRLEDGVNEWCADAPIGSETVLPWSSFTRDCNTVGDGASFPGAGSSLRSVSVVQYGDEVVATKVDLCLLDISVAP